MLSQDHVKRSLFYRKLIVLGGLRGRGRRDVRISKGVSRTEVMFNNNVARFAREPAGEGEEWKIERNATHSAC